MYGPNHEERHYRQEKQENKDACMKMGTVIFVIWLLGSFLEQMVNLVKYRTTSISYIWMYFMVVNLITFAVNLADKMIAKYTFDMNRVPEDTLHVLSFIGGASATSLAMTLINHKSSKISYQNKYMVVCCIHTLFVIVLSVIWLCGLTRV